MGKQPSSVDRQKTHADELLQAVKQITEDQRKFMAQCVADVQGYTAGATEELMLQVGRVMTVQEAIIEYLEELSNKRRDDVGAELRVKSIVEQNIAKAKAAREAERAKAEEKPVLTSVPVAEPDDEVAAAYAAAERLVRTGPNKQPVGPRADMTKECTCNPRHPMAYLDDPGSDFDCPHHGFEATKEVPADIAPAAPADVAPPDAN